MTIVLATIVSVLAIAGVAWAASRGLRLPLCPVCSGVVGTWLWMVIARHFGFVADAAMLSTLLGGSVVGIAYQLERRLAEERSPLLWKTLFIPTGFAAAYGLAVADWALLAITLAVLLLLVAYILSPRRSAKSSNPAVHALECKMKNCC